MSIAAKIGCAPQILNDWVKKAEVDSGKRAGVSSEMAERMKALERENRELHQGEEDQGKVRGTLPPTNEILRKAIAYFAMVRKAVRHCFSTAWSGSTAGRSDGQIHR